MHLGRDGWMISHDRDHAHTSHLYSQRVVLLQPEHGVWVHDVPPTEQLAEGEQHERTLLIAEDTACRYVVDFLTQGWNWLSPAFAGPVLEELDHLGSVLASLIGIEDDRPDEDVDNLTTLKCFLALVYLAKRVDEYGLNSSDVHRGYFLSVGDDAIMTQFTNIINIYVQSWSLSLCFQTAQQ